MVTTGMVWLLFESARDVRAAVETTRTPRKMRAQSTEVPPVRLSDVPVSPRARSEAANTTASASSASVVASRRAWSMAGPR